MKLCLVMLLVLLAGTLIAQPRLDVSLNGDWKFVLANPAGAEVPGFDESEWSNITLPHTWNATDGQD